MHFWLLIGGAGRPTSLYVQVAGLVVLETGLKLKGLTLTLSKAFSRPSYYSQHCNNTRITENNPLFGLLFFFDM